MSPWWRDTKDQQMGLHQTKKFCTAKETINKMNRQHTEWENIFTNDTIDKGLISKIYKELTKINIHTHAHTHNNLKKWTKNLNRHLSKDDIQMANRHMKWYSMSLIVRQMPIKTTMRYHLIPVRMAIINKSTNYKCWWGCGKRRNLMHCCWECKLVQTNGAVFWPSDPTSGNIPKGTHNTNSKEHERKEPYVHYSVIYNSKAMEATYLSISRWVNKKLWDMYTVELDLVIKKRKCYPL